MLKDKRILILILAVLIIALAGYSINSVEKKSEQRMSKDLSIYITTDIHYISDKINDHGEAFQKFIASGDGKQLPYIDAILNAFTYEVKKTKPDVLIISGDLTCNGEKLSHSDVAKKLKSIEKGGTSVYVIPGNHDILNPWARGFKEGKQYVIDSISDKEFSQIYADYGYKKAISRDTNTLSYLAAPSKDVWLLMIDTNKYKNNLTLGYPQDGGILGKGTFDWIAECCALAKEKGATIITVMHHNVLKHSEVLQEGYTLDDNDQTRIILKENQINLVFSGHIHVQDISSDVNNPGQPFYEVTNNALSVYPHQYGVIKYSVKDGSIDYSTKKLDVEQWAKASNSKDENLIHFVTYSEDYFGKAAYQKTYNNLSKNTDLPEKDLRLISETMKALNSRYFAGTENLNSKDVVNSEGYQLINKLEDSFLKEYMNSIVSDKDMDDNKLHLKINNINNVIK